MKMSSRKYSKRLSKYTFEVAKELFESHGCRLAMSQEEYTKLYNSPSFKGSNQPIDWICSCQDGKKEQKIQHSSIVSFRRTKRCRSCGIKNSKKQGRITYQTFCDMLETEDWKMLSPESEYHTTKTLMRVQTASGHECKTSYNRFQQGHRAKVDKDNSEKHSQEKIEKDFYERGFEVLDKYTNKSTPLRVKCRHGHITKLRYENLNRRLRGCGKCFEIKYGTVHNSQVPYIRKKMQSSMAKGKGIYTFPSGRKVEVMGYEPKCLDYLQSELGVPENDIVVDPTLIPIIRYSFEGKKCRYFPDIYIPSKNLVIEVKSPGTFKMREKRNLAKFEATRKLYPFRVYIFGEKRLLETWHYSKKKVLKINYSKKANFPPNFDFEERWKSHCVPHLENPKIIQATQEGILRIAGMINLEETPKPPCSYSSRDDFGKYFDSLEKQIIKRDNLYIVYDEDEEEDWKEECPDSYYKQTQGKEIVTWDEFKDKYYGEDGELEFKNRKDDIFYWIVPGKCHSWNSTFSLALAKLVYPKKEWEVIKGVNHSTVVDKDRSLCFDLVYANLLKRDGELPNPLEEALTE